MTKIQARIVAFFSKPSVQSVIRHALTAAIAAAVPVFAVGGVAGLASGAGAALIIRAVWVSIRPTVIQDVAEADVAPSGGAGNPEPVGSSGA